jgi:hypothetical protein
MTNDIYADSYGNSVFCGKMTYNHSVVSLLKVKNGNADRESLSTSPSKSLPVYCD